MPKPEVHRGLREGIWQVSGSWGGHPPHLGLSRMLKRALRAGAGRKGQLAEGRAGTPGELRFAPFCNRPREGLGAVREAVRLPSAQSAG